MESVGIQVRAFFHQTSSTLTYVVFDPTTLDAVVIDPVLDFDPGSGRVWRESLDQWLGWVREKELRLHASLETHVHADHLSGSFQLKRSVAGIQTVIGAGVRSVVDTFAPVFGIVPQDPSEVFGRLADDRARLEFGSLQIQTLATPGHTPACVCYHIGKLLFTGDTIFMPDFGTGRCDFPNGSAAQLYDSIAETLYHLDDDTRIYVGHDYQPGGRELAYETTIGDQKRTNVHLPIGTKRGEFIQMRQGRDATLRPPQLLHYALQINLQGGRLPQADGMGRSFLKLPLAVEC